MSMMYPEWKRIVWRGFRAAVASGVGAVVVLKVDWSDPEVAVRLVAGAFLSGFLVSAGMWVRDILGSKQGTKLIDKIPL